jgi:PAS domain S-box-containing protein
MEHSETNSLPNREELFRQVLEASPDGFTILRNVWNVNGELSDFIIEYTNPIAAQSVHRTPNDLLGQSLLSLFPDCKTSGIFDRYVTVVQTGMAATFEAFYERQDLTGWFRHVVVPLSGRIAVSVSNITDCKQAELALRQQEQHFRVALQTAKLGSWEHDLVTGVLTCSAQCKANFGLPADAEFTHETLFAALHPDDRPLVQTAIQRSITERTDYEVEERCYHPDGSLHWLIVRGQIVYDAKDMPIRMVGVTLDITDRKRTEIALQESQELFQSFMNHSPIAAFIKDEAGRYLYANSWVERIYQRSQSELLGKTDFELLPPAIAQQFHINDVAVLASGEPMQMLETIHHQDGEHRYMSFKFPFCTGSGKPVLAGVAIDVSERIQAEKALERYQLLSEHSRDIVLYFRRSGQILEANQAAVQAYGYDRAELLTLRIADLRAPETRDAIPEQFEQAAQQGILFETVHCRKDGSRFPVEVSSQSAVIGTEDVVLSVIRDITERKKAELEREQLLVREQAARRVAEAAEQRAEFLAETSKTLTSSLDYEYTLSSVAQAVVPTLADWCAVDILKDDGCLERLATTHIDPAKVQWGLELHRRYPPDLNAPRGIAQVLRSGQSEYYPTITDEQIVAVARDPEHLRILREIGFSSAMLVPLRARNKTLGTISFIAAESGRSYSLDDLSLAEELARRAAIALDNARLYQEAQLARQAAERAADRTARLQTVTAALSESLTPVQVAEVIVEQSLSALEADAALMALLSEDGTSLEVVRMEGYGISAEAAQQRFSVHASVPLAEAVRTGQPMWSEPTAERLARYPHLAETYKRFPFEAWISLPLVVEGQAVGGLSLSFKQFKLLNQDDRDFVLALSRQCAQAIVRAQLYEAEQQSRAEAERANRIKDEFLAVLSHELRSPLNPILGWAKLLQTRQFDASATQKALETIERNAKLQTQLIDDLLDVSRILRGKMALDICSVDLVSVIDAALETVRLSAEAKNIEIQKVIAHNIGLISGDPGRLQQVVWNLLSNAIKFTPTGGHVAIELSLVADDRPSVTDHRFNGQGQKTHYAQIQVKDTGKGITPEFLPHVFEYFRQEDGTTTRKFGGLGLGLAIVRYLTEQHGGTVQAESAGEGCGATFTIRLPLKKDEKPETEKGKSGEISTVSSTSYPLQGLRILIVDDEPDMRELIFTILEQAGAAVTVATSAIAALEKVDAFKPDLLISDIGMPEMDGYTLVRQIRGRSPAQGGTIPAIALTAYAGEINQQQAFAAGFQRHLAKPIDPDELVQAIVTMVNSSLQEFN